MSGNTSAGPMLREMATFAAIFVVVFLVDLWLDDDVGGALRIAALVTGGLAVGRFLGRRMGN